MPRLDDSNTAAKDDARQASGILKLIFEREASPEFLLTFLRDRGYDPRVPGQVELVLRKGDELEELHRLRNELRLCEVTLTPSFRMLEAIARLKLPRYSRVALAKALNVDEVELATAHRINYAKREWLHRLGEQPELPPPPPKPKKRGSKKKKVSAGEQTQAEGAS
jgi:hypothetical protein